MGKFDWSGLAGNALKLGGSIFGGIKLSHAMKDIKKNIEQQQKENKDWYDRRYNEDATQRADAQRLLNMAEERIRQRNRQAAGQAAVGGASTEAAAAAAEQNSQDMANATAQINAAAASQKDAIEGKYMANKAALNDQLNKYRMGTAQAIAAAASQTADAGDKIASII